MYPFSYSPTGPRAVVNKFLLTNADTEPLVVVPSSNLYSKRFHIRNVDFQNRTAGAVAMGIGGRIKTTLWKAGQIDASNVYTDGTTGAQTAGAAAGDNFALGTVNVNNTGFLVACQARFNIVSVNVNTAASGGTPAWALGSGAVRYSTTGGTWTNLASDLLVAPLFTSAGENLVWFLPPTDWVVMSAGHGTGVPTGYFGLQIRATTQGTASAGTASRLCVGQMERQYSAVAAGGMSSWGSTGEITCSPAIDALVAAISVTDPQNSIALEYRLSG